MARRLGGGVLYVLAGPSAISANLWEVVASSGTERELTSNPSGYGISWVSASPAGVVMADAITGADALAELTGHGPRLVNTSFVAAPPGMGEPTTATPSIGASGQVAFVTPPVVVRKTADDEFIVWLKRSALGAAHAIFALANPPISGEVFGPGGALAVPANTGLPPLAGYPPVIWVLRPGKAPVSLNPHLSSLLGVCWSADAPGLAVDNGVSDAELLYLDGRRVPLPPGWLVLSWSPDGSRVLVERGRSFGTWSPGAPTRVSILGTVPDAARIYQVVWMAGPAPLAK